MAVDTEQVVREMLNLTPVLRRHVMRPMESCFDHRVSGNQLSILRALVDEGAQTMRMLSDRLAVCRQQMTQLIDELEMKALVRRAPSKTDRRSVTIQLTDQGLEYMRQVDAAILRGLHPIFDGYSDEQKADLIKSAQAFIRLMEG